MKLRPMLFGVIGLLRPNRQPPDKHDKAGETKHEMVFGEKAGFKKT